MCSTSAYRPLAGALVEALDGPRAGTSTTADARGQFSFEGVFDNATRFRASGEGHIAATLPFNSGSTPRDINFYLVPAAPSVNIGGEYTLTFIADGACTDLPSEARTRTYGARVTSNPSRPATYFDVWVSGPPFLSGFDSSERFAIAVAADYAKFWLGDGQTQPAFVEQLTPSTYIAFGGAASAFVGASSSIETPVNGFIDYCVMKSATEFPVEGYRYNCAQEKALTHLRCESQGHRLTMTRR